MDLLVLLGVDLAVLRWAWRFVRRPDDPHWLLRLASLFPLRRRWLRYLLATLCVAVALAPWIFWSSAEMTLGNTWIHVIRVHWIYRGVGSMEGEPPQGLALIREGSRGRIAVGAGDVSYEVWWVRQ